MFWWRIDAEKRYFCNRNPLAKETTDEDNTSGRKAKNSVLSLTMKVGNSRVFGNWKKLGSWLVLLKLQNHVRTSHWSFYNLLGTDGSQQWRNSLYQCDKKCLKFRTVVIKRRIWFVNVLLYTEFRIFVVGSNPTGANTELQKSWCFSLFWEY